VADGLFAFLLYSRLKQTALLLKINRTRHLSAASTAHKEEVFMVVNHTFKNSVFSLLFNEPDILRELYCALENVTLPPDTPVNINTLQNVLFMDSINDISFEIGGRLVVLLEHQSSVNPNMGLRFLMYISKIYEEMNEKRALYSSKLVRIPKPEFFVLYNGLAPCPDEQTLKLSDSFMDTEALGLSKEQNQSLELIVRVLNINDGRNAELASRSKTLSEYSTFVALVRYFTRQLGDKQKAMQAAVQKCLECDILKEFMEKHKQEVLNMRITEWNQEEAIAVWREEGREDGIALGLERGREQTLLETARKLKAMGLPTEQIATATGLTLEDME
jgi:predicted transposase/invertase (TIGR01784 family)